MTKKIVAVDMDDTILYLMKAIMEDHNAKFPDHLVAYENMIAFDDSMLHPEYNKIDYFNTPGTFFNLNPIDNYVIDELKKINDKYDLVIVTSAFPRSVNDKWRWVQHHLPFLPFSNFITAGRKDLIQADILIDDAQHNVEKWVKTGRPALVPEHHWNKDLGLLPGVTMFGSWKGLTEKIDDILS